MEDHYSSEDEEVFFGSLAGAEISKRRRFLGDNYNSPVTPRPPRFHASNGTQGSLPDILGTAGSTPVQKQLSAGSGNDQSMHVPPVDSPHNESDDDVIILDSSRFSNSIITLSDDESFIRNEETRSETSVRGEGGGNQSMAKEPVSINNISSENETAKVSEPLNGSFIFDKDIDTDPVRVKDKSLHQSNINNSDRGLTLSQNSSLNNFETNNLQTQSDRSCELKSNMENSSSSLVQDIADFIDDSNDHDKSSAMIDEITVGHDLVKPNYPQSLASNQSTSEEICLEISNFIVTNPCTSEEPSELQSPPNIIEEGTVDNAEKYRKGSFDMSGLSNLEFSLNGVTDSILNISHGSSLPSPPDTQHSVSHVFQKPNSYEDITCTDEQFGNISDNSIVNQIIHLEKEDLHMSVDEIFQQQGFTEGNAINISQPSEYKSCPSACSSYSTAYDKTCGENNSNSEQSNSFQNYRDVSTDLDVCAETDAVSIKSDEENINEASFEMVLQNRQNSFNGTPASQATEKNEEVKPKAVSKLPVFHNSKSLLKPPMLHVKPDTLKTSSYKFARQMSKTSNEKTSSNFPKPALTKLPGPSGVTKHVKSPSAVERKILSEKEKTFTRTPARIGTPKQNMPTPMPKSKIPSQSYLSVNKTPAQNVLNKSPAQNVLNKSPAQNFLNKTPAQNILNKTPAQKIVSKIPAQNVLSKTPAQKILSKTPTKSNVNRTPALPAISGIPRAVNSDTKALRVLTPLSNFNSSAGKMKNKYQNVISPIQAYIRGSPPVAQRKAQVINEENKSPDKQESVPKALQKLKFDTVQGQENINPNVLDLSRDTLPCKVLEPSLQVFWREQEKPQKHLPKMGEKVTKILSGPPKVKVTVHEGRVNQSPRSKGVLVPNNENSASTSSDILNDDNFPEQSDGRISVRIQNIAELP